MDPNFPGSAQPPMTPAMWQALAARMAGAAPPKPGMAAPSAPMPQQQMAGQAPMMSALPGGAPSPPSGWGPYAGPVEGPRTANPAAATAPVAPAPPTLMPMIDMGGGSTGNGGSGMGGQGFGGPGAAAASADIGASMDPSSGSTSAADSSNAGGVGADPDGGAAYATGGVVNELTGDDPPGPDDGSANLDRGEYVVQQQAVENVGTDVLDAINKGDLETAIELLEAKLGGEPEDDAETPEEDAASGDGVEDALRKNMKGVPSRP